MSRIFDGEESSQRGTQVRDCLSSCLASTCSVERHGWYRDQSSNQRQLIAGSICVFPLIIWLKYTKRQWEALRSKFRPQRERKVLTSHQTFDQKRSNHKCPCPSTSIDCGWRWMFACHVRSGSLTELKQSIWSPGPIIHGSEMVIRARGCHYNPGYKKRMWKAYKWSTIIWSWRALRSSDQFRDHPRSL